MKYLIQTQIHLKMFLISPSHCIYTGISHTFSISPLQLHEKNEAVRENSSAFNI